MELKNKNKKSGFQKKIEKRAALMSAAGSDIKQRHFFSCIFVSKKST